MQDTGLKIDLHVHSQYSKRPSQWILQKIGCPESFTSPFQLYSIAKARGMDLVTITDHNTIEGDLEIAQSYQDVFLSEEVTSYFPENKCKVHILVLNITEEQHREISKIRENIYELTSYLNSRSIVHVLAHPLFDMNNGITQEIFEKMLLLFKNLELNGARDSKQNQMLQQILQGLDAEKLEYLANKHDMTPFVKMPWIKNIVSGSDDHSSLNIARSYTYISPAANIHEALAGIENGNCTPLGTECTPKTMGHHLYAIAYQYYKNHLGLENFLEGDELLKFTDYMLNNPEENKDTPVAKANFFKIEDMLQGTEINSLADCFRKEAQNIKKNLKKNPRIEDTSGDLEEEWFDFVNNSSEKMIQRFADSMLEDLFNGRLFKIFQNIGTSGIIYSLLAPYFFAFGLFKNGRRLAYKFQKLLDSEKRRFKDEALQIALFSDTYQENPGIDTNLQIQLKNNQNNNVTILTCSSKLGPAGTHTFNPLGSFQVPEYPSLKLYYPPFLNILEYCYNQEFNLIHSSTPGPMGLCALGIARILNLPIHGTFHTAIPQQLAEFTGDCDLEKWSWRYLVWYYNQMDAVYVLNRETAQDIISRGIDKNKVKVYPGRIDIERFSPAKRNGFWKKFSSLSDNSTKLLYVGNISREKNLDILSKAYKSLYRDRPNVQLIVVGQGPYLETMQQELRDTGALFSRALHGEELAQAYASSDIFVFPSSTDTAAHAVLKAQASGLPVIVTDRGAPQEHLLANQTGVIVPAQDTSSLYSSLLHLVNNPGLIAEMKKNTRNYMENRDFEHSLLKKLNLVNEITMQK